MTNLDLLTPTYKQLWWRAQKLVRLAFICALVGLFLWVLLGITSDTSIGAYEQGANEIGSLA